MPSMFVHFSCCMKNCQLLMPPVNLDPFEHFFNPFGAMLDLPGISTSSRAFLVWTDGFLLRDVHGDISSDSDGTYEDSDGGNGSELSLFSPETYRS